MGLADAFIQTDFHCIQCLSYRSSNDNFALTWSNYDESTPMYHCDKWGGAESRGSGYERHLCHSQVSSPTEELQKDKRSDNSARRERTRPGLFMLCFCLCFMWQTSPASLHSHGSQPRPTHHNHILHTTIFSANDNFSVFLTQHCVTDLEVLKYSSKVVGTFLVLYCPL